MSVDDIVAKIGGHRPFSLFIFFAIGASSFYALAVHGLIIVFIGECRTFLTSVVEMSEAYFRDEIINIYSLFKIANCRLGLVISYLMNLSYVCLHTYIYIYIIYQEY